MAHMRSAAAWITALSVTLLYQPASTLAEDAAQSHEALQHDLFGVITLAGRHCGAVVGVVENGPSDYTAECRNGKRFRVHVTSSGLHVANETPAVPGKPAAVGDKPSGAADNAPGASEDHRAAVARSLFAIINLSGYDCDEVTRFERGPQLQYRVWCGNNTDYRISVRSGGRVEVAKLH